MFASITLISIIGPMQQWKRRHLSNLMSITCCSKGNSFNSSIEINLLCEKGLGTLHNFFKSNLESNSRLPCPQFKGSHYIVKVNILRGRGDWRGGGIQFTKNLKIVSKWFPYFWAFSEHSELFSCFKCTLFLLNWI